MRSRLIWPIFWALVAVFIVIVCLFAIPAFGDWAAGSELFLLPFALFCALGIVLIVLAARDKSGGWLRKFFILTGASAAGVMVSILLHNLVYGLINYFDADFWNGGDEFFFFLMALIVCPLGFLVGAAGAIITGARNLKAAP